MYTEVKSYQIIIALLKEYGIRHLVLSAGSRNVPLVHSVEEDPFFKCYSVVDERSAAYFAMGLSQQLNEPVVISCTSSTATANYWPAVAEAYYQKVPLIIMTSDRNPAMLGQLEDQMIDQVGMYDRHVKLSVNLPIVNDKDDFIYCQRLVNEAFLELDHHGKGPVHINIPSKTYNNSFNVKELPHVTKINRIDKNSDSKQWKKQIDQLSSKKRIMVIVGQNWERNIEMNSLLKEFKSKFNCCIIAEYMSNLDLDNFVNTTLSFETRYITDKKFNEFLPEIVISFGENMTIGVKELLRKRQGEFEHWLISNDGMIVDGYKSLTTIFECPIEYFLKKFSENATTLSNNEYNDLIENYTNGVIIPEFDFCNIYAIKETVEKIPENSILHLSINSSIRITNFFKLNKGVQTYANIGTHGIDGCLSSFLGQASAIDNLAFLVIGDLSFFYDMNALRIKHIKKNVRILMINNSGGEEFYYNKMWKNASSDLHTTARHSNVARDWVKSTGFEYKEVRDKKSLAIALEDFFNPELDRPMFIEVFTEMKSDADELYKLYDISRPKDLKSESIRKSKELVKKTIGQEKAQKIASKFKKNK
ncbi:2-succinyl-5-enolpyruvyl-6-hydroxy-3-cyclohexene-1-carboxylic-acid synthase [Enterococcus casseliflavus]|uniref:2-succinyl-5-enolpyruvyl-6-hydroxy-3- cyclohexene-1-carboxylic-acid synthase n=1 Tax=Enterococcus casseliflavus TaxID=37734 RepID=UPI00191973F6|nr:2-succinyl-5-enolpyruvyl-6-hydroxy-3-cyclohexene-1-carboxylic-acid synthase [Enterococcus casseliflavus]MDV7712272.1 2-succinyl-5-enolpyruvyl-6-hydroxy-3-cyclohexene-1-carboxylic-acid synthase [Enterococcus casseliflavus]QQU15539.1 2-succinyl-5-enolpyruvyl-6-hydroxy-3-cyclohexene-1-carboxylic-acid synthase [Enterococcus casseliflavus]